MISELKLHNFRCFNSSTISLSPGINFFYGNNGSGKTSILEAIYMCSSGRSFKSSNIQSLISTDKNFFSINGYDSNRGYTLSISKEKSKSISGDEECTRDRFSLHLHMGNAGGDKKLGEMVLNSGIDNEKDIMHLCYWHRHF